ncbi:MAG TPA: methyltransferase domain-containing protein [Candidatus Limnocylindrales bacterium]|jgi:SAM-dependent methyltransferase|nr:methyltransferase domain-containing protein [Candidatus Limnocylindrales bacterium]
MTRTGGRGRGKPRRDRAIEPGRAAEALARYYDLDLHDDPGDVELYRALAARTGGPILELGVGSGRVAVPLALDGHEVVGVDHDPAALARARARWSAAGAEAKGRLELLEADLTELGLGSRFGLAILALNSLLLLAEPGRQRAGLAALARHLGPSGLAVVDIWLPGPDDLAVYDGRLVHEWTRDDPETGERVAKLASATYDAATEMVELQTVFDVWPAEGGPVRRVDRVDRLRLVGADELVRMAEEAGLAVESLSGDHALSPFGPGSERAVLVAGLV